MISNIYLISEVGKQQKNAKISHTLITTTIVTYTVIPME